MIDSEQLLSRLREGLGGGTTTLPGIEAQLRMAPRPRPGWTPGAVPEDVRDGAGLILLYPVQGGRFHIVLTVRRHDLPQHAGQVSLPGGAVEPHEDPIAAALREAHEEVGIDPGAVTVLGRLTPLHIPASGFVLHAVVGHAAARPDLLPDPREVERILEVPLEDLGDPARVRVERRSLAGRAREVPYFDLEGEKVWGATAMVLAELLWLLGTPPDPWNEEQQADSRSDPV
jgi:8-oxo-dGTP pyrophosphatase MutT (NUDIX family)